MVILLSKKKINKFTGCCIPCSTKRTNKKWTDSYHPKYTGSKKYTKDGYVMISLKSLRDSENYHIAESMAYKNGNIKRVLEHRLIMAIKIGRPLLATEIVHHKNGNKSDNSIENLELLTIKKHHKGHGDYYYQKWQEALVEIELLKKKMENK